VLARGIADTGDAAVGVGATATMVAADGATDAVAGATVAGAMQDMGSLDAVKWVVDSTVARVGLAEAAAFTVEVASMVAAEAAGSTVEVAAASTAVAADTAAAADTAKLIAELRQ
jgi:hypothetical protein